MVFGPRVVPRDVDLVIQPEQTVAFEAQFGSLIRRRTRFGGYVLNVDGWRVDVWPLEQTWAIREGLVGPPAPANLTRSTFLNVEAVAMSLRVGRGRTIHESGFFESVRRRILDINLEANPFPDLCVVRSLIMAVTLDFSLSHRLVQYIYVHSRTLDMDALLKTQEKHYGFVKRDAAYLDSWLSLIRRHAVEGTETPLHLPRAPFKQLDLLGSGNVEMIPEPTAPLGARLSK
jgi:hypothetical protein